MTSSFEGVGKFHFIVSRKRGEGGEIVTTFRVVFVLLGGRGKVITPFRTFSFYLGEESWPLSGPFIL